MNLSPSDMKNLLHHILSGKEFGVERSGEYDLQLRIQYKANGIISHALAFLIAPRCVCV